MTARRRLAAERALSFTVADLAVRWQCMGHTTSATTERHYARFGPDYLRNVAGAIRRENS